MASLSQIAGFDAKRTIDLHRQGEADALERDRRNRLARIGQIAATGDYAAAGKEAYAMGDLQTGSALTGIVSSAQANELEQQNKLRELAIKDRLAGAAELRAKRPPGGSRLVFDGKGGFTMESGAALAGNGAGAVHSTPTNAVTSDVQKDVIANQDALAELDAIEKAVKPEYFTYAGQAKQAIAHHGAKLEGMPIIGPLAKPSKEALQFGADRKAAMASIDRHFNRYRKEITGAAAAVQELARLKDAMINTNLSWPEFQQVFASYKAEIQRVEQAKANVLRRGIDVTHPDHGQFIDQEYQALSDPRMGKGDPQISPAAGSGQTAMQMRGDEIMGDVLMEHGIEDWDALDQATQEALMDMVTDRLEAEGL